MVGRQNRDGKRQVCVQVWDCLEQIILLVLRRGKMTHHGLVTLSGARPFRRPSQSRCSAQLALPEDKRRPGTLYLELEKGRL